MHSLAHSAKVAALLLLAAPAQAWVLDQSCKEYKEVVTTAVSNAFDLAANSLYTLHNKDKGNADQVVARQMLISYLFPLLPTDDDTKKNVPSTFQKVMGYGDPNQKLKDKYNFDDPAKTLPQGWGAVEDAPEDYKTLSKNNFIVYCDDSRITRDKDDLGNDITAPGGVRQYYDKTLDIVDTIDPEWEACWNGNFFSGRTTVAFALAKDDLPASIQLCPWYVQKFARSSKSVWSRGFMGNLKKMIDDEGERRNLDRSKMDETADIASTILHELTHVAANTKDLAYAWQPCVDRGGKSDTWQNADSYAMFANGAKLIEGDPPQIPTKEGDVQALALKDNKQKRQQVRPPGWDCHAGNVGGITGQCVSESVPSAGPSPPPGGEKGPSSLVTSTSSTAVAGALTTVPVTKDGKTSSVVYSSQDITGSDKKPTPVWACIGDLCDPKCRVPFLCKNDEGDCGGGNGWHICGGWMPTAGGGNLPSGGPSPPPTPAPKPGDGDKPDKKPSSTGCSVTSTSTCFERDVVSRVPVKGRKTWTWTTKATSTCTPTSACAIEYRVETSYTTISESRTYATATHWIESPEGLDLDGQIFMMEKIASNSNGDDLTWTPPARTTTNMPPPPKDTPNPPKDDPPAPAYAKGTCNIHIHEGADKDSIFAVIKVTDGAGKEIGTQSPSDNNFKYGDKLILGKNKLPYDVSAEFLGKVIDKRDYFSLGPSPMVYQAYGINLVAGGTRWTSSDTKDSTKGKLPYCNVGNWDTHESANPADAFFDLFKDKGKGNPTRDMDCMWEC